MNFKGHAFSAFFFDESGLGASPKLSVNPMQGISGPIVQVHFDLVGAPVNVFNQAVFDELHILLDQLEHVVDLAGVIFTSGKSVYVAGAEIPALLAFAKAHDVVGIHAHVMSGQHAFNRIQALPVPTVAAINGFALGGGLEFALAMDARVMVQTAKIGLPEVNLGLFPGYAGTARLPRMIDPVTAVQWITSGRPQSAKSAIEAGLVRTSCTPEALLETVLATVCELQSEYRLIRAAKQGSVSVDAKQRAELQSIAAGLDIHPGRDYPAAKQALDLIRDQFKQTAEQAGLAEAKAFAELLTSPTAINLLSVFTNEQDVARIAKRTASGKRIERVGVLGAGIMGGGIAFQSALHGATVVLKDIQSAALEQGMAEAHRNLSAQVAKGKLTQSAAEESFHRITPSLDDDAIADCDLVVEAVVEQFALKQSLLRDVEQRVGDGCVLTSNTSTISISRLAQGLTRPEQFCGLHFFNPVAAMPLVEIVRGRQTSDGTISQAVRFALQLGKHPVVVNDCPGFLVNRVLFPYIIAAQMLIAEGVDFRQIDAVMQSWGWPMGPAFLSDVIGLDTLVHCLDVMATDIPERMAPDYVSAIHTLFKSGRLGQKSGEGFYHYARSVTQDEAGRLTKQEDDLALSLVYLNAPSQISSNEIAERLTLALCFEAVRCLEEGVVSSPSEVDMALLWGLGFPRFRGGAFRHIDTLGVAEICLMAQKYAYLGPLYSVPELLQQKRKSGTSFYG